MSTLLFFSKFWVSSLNDLRKRKPGFDSKFLNKKNITKLISVHDCIISLRLIWYIVHSYSAVDGCTAINFVKHVKLVWSKLALFVLHDGICRSFHSKATIIINASALLFVLWQNLDEGSFDMLYKNYCWAAIPDPIWTTNVPYERKIKHAIIHW